MRQIYHAIMAALSVVAAILFQSMGGADKLSLALVFAMAIDYATGVACAAIWHKSPKSKNGALDSRAGLKGLFRKAGIILCVILSVRLADLLTTPAIRDSTIIFFVINESISIFENLGIMGVPYPPAIKSALDALQEKSE